VTLFNPHKGQWWNAEDKPLAYYMTLRVHYEMGALEAWNYMKKVNREYPTLIPDFLGTPRGAISWDQAMTINNLSDLGDMLAADGNDEAQLKRSIERSVYKYTDCGMWISFTNTGIIIGSIVEGSDIGTSRYTLDYPFEEATYRQCEDAVEKEASAIWKWANEEREDGQTDADHGIDFPDLWVEYQHLPGFSSAT